MQSRKLSTARHRSTRSISWCRIVCGHTVCSLGFKGKHLERVPCTNMHLYSLTFHPFPQNIPGLPECQVPGPANWNSPEKGGEGAGWGLWRWRGGHFLPAPGCARESSEPHTQIVLLETAAPAKGTTWQHLSGRVAAYNIPLFPCQPGSQDGEAGFTSRRNLCFSQEVDYRKDVDAPQCIAGTLQQGREQRRLLSSRT